MNWRKLLGESLDSRIRALAAGNTDRTVVLGKIYKSVGRKTKLTTNVKLLIGNAVSVAMCEKRY